MGGSGSSGAPIPAFAMTAPASFRLFAAAARIEDVETREEFVAACCGDDPATREEVMRLLDLYGRGDALEERIRAAIRRAARELGNS